MSALVLHRLKLRSMSTGWCVWGSCDPEHREQRMRRVGVVDVVVAGRPMGVACGKHAKEVEAIWAGTLDAQPHVVAVAA